MTESKFQFHLFEVGMISETFLKTKGKHEGILKGRQRNWVQLIMYGEKISVKRNQDNKHGTTL